MHDTKDNVKIDKLKPTTGFPGCAAFLKLNLYAKITVLLKYFILYHPYFKIVLHIEVINGSWML